MTIFQEYLKITREQLAEVASCYPADEHKTLRRRTDDLLIAYDVLAYRASKAENGIDVKLADKVELLSHRFIDELNGGEPIQDFSPEAEIRSGLHQFVKWIKDKEE